MTESAMTDDIKKLHDLATNSPATSALYEVIELINQHIERFNETGGGLDSAYSLQRRLCDILVSRLRGE